MDVSELRKSLAAAKERIYSILKRLNWSEEDLLADSDELVQCSVNPSHYVPADKLTEHSEVCRLVQGGMSREDAKKLQEIRPYYKDKSIPIDDEKIKQVLGINVKNLATEQHHLMYDYFQTNYPQCSSAPTVEIDESLSLTAKQVLKRAAAAAEQANTEAERGVLDRDLKRRRQSYRAKNVHITQKSYTEIIREVLANQMEMHFPGQTTEVEPEPESSSKSDDTKRSKRKRSRSRSKSRSDQETESKSSRTDDEKDSSKKHRRKEKDPSRRHRDERDSERSRDQDSRSHRKKDHKHKHKRRYEDY